MTMCLEKEIYINKKICILGCGSSVDKKDIDFCSYDYVVGINRIYQTKYIKNINILYDSSHYLFDPLTNTKVNILNKSNLKYYFLIPGSIGLAKIKMQKAIFEKIKIPKKIYSNRSDIIVDGKKVLAGLFVLSIIAREKPELIDIYGFDFYKENYIEKLCFKHNINEINKIHNLKKEEDRLVKLLEKNKFINWIK